MKNTQTGFRLVEIAIMIAIVGILISVAAPLYQNRVVGDNDADVAPAVDTRGLSATNSGHSVF